MRTISKISLISLIVSLIITSCSKDDPKVNIQLYDEPLYIIKSNIQGKWQLQYSKGGIGNTVQYPKNNYWIFNFQDRDRVKILNEANIGTDTIISWYKEVAPYTRATNLKTDSTFVMKFYDKQNVPWHYVIDGIYNDTLILHDFSSDANFYHFTKL